MAEGTVAAVTARGTVDVPADQFAARLARYPEVLVDLGTGDGRFALRTARARPEALVVGIDPVASAMAGSANKAARKPARGGANNVVFVVASLERLPDVLRATADSLTVNFPWGSLLLAIAWPRPAGLRAIVELLAPRGTLQALLNASAGEQAPHAQRLDLPPLEEPAHVESRLVPGWEAAGLDAVTWGYLAPGEDPPSRTTWGQRLVRGSGRVTLRVDATRSLEAGRR